MKFFRVAETMCKLEDGVGPMGPVLLTKVRHGGCDDCVRLS